MPRPADRPRACHFTGEHGRLFGVYHPAAPVREREEGILLVPPVGHESIGAHWLGQEVALQASAAGFHVLRFDLSGQGDSAGAFEEVTVDAWLNDVASAMQELKDQSGVPRVALLGLRVGALLACEAARRETPHRLWLWDPPATGAAYVARLRHMQAERRRDWPFAPVSAAGAAEEDLLGYTWSAALLAGLAALPLQPPPRTRRLHWLGPAPQAALAARLAPQARFHSLTEAIAWDEVARFDEPLLLGSLVAQVAAALTGEAP